MKAWLHGQSLLPVSSNQIPIRQSRVTGPDRGSTSRRPVRARQPANAPVGPIRQASSCDSVLKPVRAARRQNREAMRPKKTILCVDDNEQILSVRTFLLETRGYRVIALASPQDALDSHRPFASRHARSAALRSPDAADGRQRTGPPRQADPPGPAAMIISGTVTGYDRAGRADVFLPKGACSPAELLERVRVLVARKRGPRKASRAVPSVSSSNYSVPVSA